MASDFLRLLIVTTVTESAPPPLSPGHNIKAMADGDEQKKNVFQSLEYNKNWRQ